MWHIFPMSSLSASVTCLWWVAGELCIAMGITTHSYRPDGISVAMYLMWSGWTRFWKKEFVMSIFFHILPFAQSARMSSSWGEGSCQVQWVCSGPGSHLPNGAVLLGWLLELWMMVMRKVMKMGGFFLLWDTGWSEFSSLSSIFSGMHTHKRQKLECQVVVWCSERHCRGGLWHVGYQMGNGQERIA